MSDEHHGPPHDLPPAQVRARVYKDGLWWRWEHACNYRGGVVNYGYPQRDQPTALNGALRHLMWCV